MSVKHCSSRNLCPIGLDLQARVARARLADSIDRGRTGYVGRAYDDAMAAWARHSAECRTVRPVACDACAMVSINGRACHEHGCPHARRVSP